MVLCIQTFVESLIGFTIILFSLKSKSIVFSDSLSKVVNSMSLLLEIADIVLSPAKLYISDFFKVETRSLRSMLKRVGPKMEPWGTPDIKV